MREMGLTMADEAWRQEVVDADPFPIDVGAVSAEATELPLVTWEPTGDEAVDTALARLAIANGLPPAEQVDIFDELHRDLHSRLGQGARDVQQVGGTEH